MSKTSVEVAFSTSEGSKSNLPILKSVKINLRPQFSRGPLTHLEPLLLAQSCPSMHYESFLVSKTLVVLAFSTSEGMKSNSPNLRSVKINLRPQFSRGPLTHLEPLLLAQSCPSMHYESFLVSKTLVVLAFSTSEGMKSNSPNLRSVKINLRPQFSRGPLTHLEPLLLAQSCPSMHYESFFVSRTLVEVDN